MGTVFRSGVRCVVDVGTLIMGTVVVYIASTGIGETARWPGEEYMRKLVYLIALAMLTTLIVAPAAVAQDATCEQVLDRVYAGDPYLTSAELLSCGISPEAIGAGPSINGPYGVGTTNVCSGLPQGSPESVACFEELIAYMGY